VLDVAPELLGCVLQRTTAAGTVSIRITEVEAYAGERDAGAHAYRGKTNRNKTMFGPAGHIYCYFTYGMHHAIGLVTAQPDQPYTVASSLPATSSRAPIWPAPGVKRDHAKHRFPSAG
jgi:DNA-3-methyladenine glycosylase